jgi:hypothetical protein
VQQTTDIALSNHAFWLLATGAVVPIVVYVFNHFAEGWIEAIVAAIFRIVGVTLSQAGRKVFAEAAKGVIQVSAAAAWGVIYTAVINGAHGEHIFKGAGAAVLSALFAHNILWKPSNINVVFGAQPSSATAGVAQALFAAPQGTRALTRADLFS